ncbi:MAG: hypothetical protein K2Y08_00555 [Alphaproteobacteria bacterium]|nr:hypothetical protein [Alphaproteobacteria bacterium]
MKLLITSSLIIGAVFLLGASTVLNAIDTQPVLKSTQDSNIVKVRGGFHGGGFGHMGGGNFGHGGFHHDGNFNHYRGWNGGGVDVGVGIGVGPSYIEGPGYDYDTGPVCVGPDCEYL